ncbi:MAG: hypothetical protein WC182_03295 [Bacilli bacterium]
MIEYKRNRKLRNSLFIFKAILFIAFSFIIIHFTALTAHAFDSGLTTQDSEIKVLTKKLSELSEYECIEFIVENDIKIPQELEGSTELGVFVKWVIETVEINSNYEFMYNYEVLHNFVESIRELVINKSVSQPTKDGQAITANTTYTLQDNTQYGAWNNNFSDYNCYIYSIGRTDVFKNPGFFQMSHLV